MSNILKLKEFLTTIQKIDKSIDLSIANTEIEIPKEADALICRLLYLFLEEKEKRLMLEKEIEAQKEKFNSTFSKIADGVELCNN